jgi:hypothetical protein
MKKYSEIKMIYFLLACSEQTMVYEKIVEVTNEDPNIVVIPREIDFDHVIAGSEKELEVIIANTGGGELDILSISLESNNDLELNDNGVEWIVGYDQESIYLKYSPQTFQYDNSNLVILSNDPDESEIIVPIQGIGDAPVISISPSEKHFDDIQIGCKEEDSFDISNIGNLNLKINDIYMLSSVPNNFLLDLEMQNNGNLSWDIQPGDKKEISVHYTPEDVIQDGAVININSNDPETPDKEIDITGSHIVTKYLNQTFIYNEGDNIDVLFVIDNSGSMSPFQNSLGSHFGDFLNYFTSSGIDYRIGIITTDDSLLIGSYIDNTSLDPINDFLVNLSLATTYGSGIERGLEMSYLATNIGNIGYNPGFIRADAYLALIFLSDEPDHSHRSINTYTSHFENLKQDKSMIIAHSIIGDYPSGCGGGGWNGLSADFGSGYYEFVNYFGGINFSICATDWGLQMQNLAFSTANWSGFVLLEEPIEGTIEVYVDGIFTSDWTYNSSENKINFNSSYTLEEGSEVYVSYGVREDCN